MPEEILEEPWYRCLRCRAMFKLKNLIIRHCLIVHKVHRFENDSDTKCADDWERVMRVMGGNVVKVDLPKEDVNISTTSLEVQSHQQTSWVIEGQGQPTSTLTLITVNANSLGGEDHAYIGPFDPIISQTFLKFDETSAAPSMTASPLTIISSASTNNFPLPTTEDLYRCRYCSAPFAHSRSRAVHEAKVHNEEIDGYPCQICQKNFPTIASVQDHYRCTHKMTPPVKKAWKLWKTHGGDINDHLHQPRAITSHPPLQLSLPSPQQQQTVHTLALHPVCREVIVMGTIEGSQHHQLESYYFNPETGSISIAPQQTSPSAIKPDDHQHTLQLDKKKRGRKSKFSPDGSSPKNKMSSTISKPKKSKLSKSSTSSSCPKLPKDSPFRYQRLKCPKCQTRFRTQWEQTVHLGQIHAEFSCEFCSLVFMEKVEMVRHQYTVHNTEMGYYKCHVCRRNFGSPRIVQEHVYESHPESKVPSTSVALKWRRA